MFGNWGLAAFVLWPVAFVAWAHPLLRGSGHLLRRTVVLSAVLFLLSIAGFVVGWPFGLQYQGALFTWGCLALSLALAAGVGFLALSCRRRPSFPKNLAAHWLLFAWALTYAFPYLGETP